MFSLATTVLAFLTSATMATNYCDIRLCDPGLKNIGCNNAGKICAGGIVYAFNSSLIQITLDEHNTLRQKIASGGQAGFPPAQRMATLVSIHHKSMNL